jgi:hypothetical protein
MKLDHSFSWYDSSSNRSVGRFLGSSLYLLMANPGGSGLPAAAAALLPRPDIAAAVPSISRRASRLGSQETANPL